jgi:galactoside O-acetyltransferase
VSLLNKKDLYVKIIKSLLEKSRGYILLNSFYSQDELSELGFQNVGDNVLLSKKASFYSPQNISLGNHVRIDDFCILSGRISIGNYVHVAAYSALFGGDAGIEISDFANISSRVSIYAINDDYSGETMTNPMVPDEYKNVEQKKVIIGRHSIIGATSVVLPGVAVAEGGSFGAFSLICKSTQPWSIYAGIPCKKIKERSRNLLILEKQFLGGRNI